MDIKKWYDCTLTERAKKALEKNGFKVRCFETKEQAAAALVAEIPSDKSIGMGGSATLMSMGLYELFKERGNTLFSHTHATSPEEAMKCRKAQLSADVFMCSTNALTLDGQLVNIDGVGNRVAAMCFGPDKVYVICGVNKIVENEQEGRKRIGNVASPMNAQRLKKAVPCATTCYCHDCSSPERMCRIVTIIPRKPMATDLEIIIIQENLGF